MMCIVESKTSESAIVHLIAINNGRNWRTFMIMHIQRDSMVVDKHRERAIVHQICHTTTSICIFIASKTFERAIVRHIASNERINKIPIAWHVYGNSITIK
jgi:hypothetical protein